MSLSPISPPTLRQRLNRVVGFAGQIVGGATGAVPGAMVGGLYAAQWKMPKESRHSRELGALLHAGISVASSLAQQVGAEALFPVQLNGLSATNLATAAAGSAWQYYSGGSGEIAEQIYQAVDKQAARTADTPTMIGKGLYHGLVEGARGGAHEGRMQGVGIVEGTIEGAKDGWRGLQGKWDAPEASLSHSQAKPMARKIFESSAGLLGGLLGASLYALDGAVQGTVRGVLGTASSSTASHKVQAVLAGAVAGAVLLGPLGIAGGMIVGKWASTLIDGGEQPGPAPATAGQSLAKALDDSLSNDPDLGDSQANTYRNTIEGALVGCLVGGRNGLKAGSQSAQRRASAAWEQIAHTPL